MEVSTKKEGNKKYTCANCNYQTNRKYNLLLHHNKKIPCSSSTDDDREGGRGNRAHENIKRKGNITAGRICEVCEEIFPNRQAKYRHKKKSLCKSPDVKSSGVNLSYFPYDKPFVEHVNAEVVKNLYFLTGRNTKRLINEGVRKIYKEIPKNNSFRFPLGLKSNEVEVYHEGGKRLLPLDDVIDTVLRRTSMIFEKHLSDHYDKGSIIGSACLNHVNILKNLISQDVGIYDELRSEYYPYVKSAMLECLLHA